MASVQNELVEALRELHHKEQQQQDGEGEDMQQISSRTPTSDEVHAAKIDTQQSEDLKMLEL